ncbi:hypothetical protein CLV44_11335 [Marinobacterium halophilum]|uniref:Copper(I)-binding protein n=1 Tax=Marinobacterium halophilum TaxID=267374 RepID=A0A2P8EUR1_9GAMM|nr:copper chaperone PCu(A)C [Marinobacterium halophilum]PSL13206.1 hypothetical protein CLV44_11335 [Marinobacterium halophilum]
MKRLLTFITTGCLLSSNLFAADVQVDSAYVRATPPGQINSAVFMQIQNQGDATALVGANSPAAKVVELHTHQHDQGVMRMRKVETIALPHATQVNFAPGGMHIMLIGLKAPLQADTRIDMTLNFADGTEQQLSVPVQHVMPTGMKQGTPMSHGAHQ